MCIALVTTAHPNYALIILDNRDEYVLRPTSRPYWWTHKPSGLQILSARDLLRRERGTWMGISKTGRLAVLTNYREDTDDPEHPVQGLKSRGGMVTAWLAAPAGESLDDFVKVMLEGRMVKGVGGFSLLCGDLKRKGDKNIEPLVIISNRSEGVEEVPKIGGERGGTWGLSNTVYEEPPTWPKIISGKSKLEKVVQEAVQNNLSEDALVDALYSVLDTDELPLRSGMSFEQYVGSLRQSIFISSVSNEARDLDMQSAIDEGKMKAAFDEVEDESHELIEHEQATSFEKGTYGTQRQTIWLVDWEGNVTYKERALWDSHGNRIERGQGDVTFTFAVDGWE